MAGAPARLVNFPAINIGAIAAECGPQTAKEISQLVRFLEQNGQRNPQNATQAGTRPGINIPPTNPAFPDLAGYFLLIGRPGNQIAYGGTTSGGFLKLRSTSGGTKGLIYLGSADISAYNDTNDRLGIGTIAPTGRIHAKAASTAFTSVTPASTISVAANWVDNAGGTTNFHTPLADNDDATWVENNPLNASVFEVKLATIVDPGTSTGWSIRLRARFTVDTASVETIVINVRNGGVSLFSKTVAMDGITSPTTIDTALSSSEAAQIQGASLSDIRFRVSAGGGVTVPRIFQLLLLVPNAGGTGTTEVIIAEGGVGQDKDWYQMKLNGGNTLGFRVPTGLVTHFLTWPSNVVAGGFLKTDGSGTLAWDPTPGAHALLSTTHTDTVAHTPVLGDIIAANSTPAWQAVAGNTTATRKFLRQTGNGSISALPAWDTLVVGDVPAHNFLSATHGDTLAASPTRGDIVVANSTPAWARFAVGAADKIVQSDGTDPSYQDPLRLGATAYDTNTPLPPIPTANKVRIYADSMGTSGARLNPAFRREDSRGQWLQGMLGWNGAVLIVPDTSTNPGVLGTHLGAASGTVSHPTLSSTNLLTSTRQISCTSAIAANAVAEIFENQLHIWRGNAANLGGFYFISRFHLVVDPSVDQQFGFCGLLSNLGAAGATTPGNQTNILGVGVESGDTVWSFFNNDGAGTANKTSTGINFAITSGPFQLEMFCPPNGGTVYWRFMRMDDLTVAPAVGSVNTGTTGGIPSNTTFLNFHIYANSGPGGVDPAIWKLIRTYIECDV